MGSEMCIRDSPYGSDGLGFGSTYDSPIGFIRNTCYFFSCSGGNFPNPGRRDKLAGRSDVVDHIWNNCTRLSFSIGDG